MNATRMLDRTDRRAFGKALAAAGLSPVATPLFERGVFLDDVEPELEANPIAALEQVQAGI